MRLDESFQNQCFTFSKVPCASSYGHFIARKEFWSQCHILRFRNTFEIKSGGRLYPEALFIGRPSLSVVPGPVLKDLFIGFNRMSLQMLYMALGLKFDF